MSPRSHISIGVADAVPPAVPAFPGISHTSGFSLHPGQSYPHNTLQLKSVAPIGLILQVPKLVEDPNRDAAFDGTDKVGYRYLRRAHHNQVDVVNLDIQFHDLTFKVFGEGPKAASYFCSHLASEHPETVLGCPYNVVLTMPNRM